MPTMLPLQDLPATLRPNIGPYGPCRKYRPYKKPLPPQRGVALFAVMVIVLLSMLLALWASRSALFNEMIVGNDADYQRAYEAAQAMMQDAELDIRTASDIGGLRCEPLPAGGATRGCNPDGAIIPIPKDKAELSSKTKNRLELPYLVTGLKCESGLCLMRPSTEDPDFWSDAAKFDKWKPVGARYGQYSGAATVASGASSASNPILQDRAWYWIEIAPYTGCDHIFSQNGRFPVICSSDNLVYRITAIALGLKPGTRVVLQETYINENHE